MKPQPKRITEAEYLAREVARLERYEFVDGVEYCMSGASGAHNDIVVNLVSVLNPQLRPKGCGVRVNDQRVKARDRFYYPDVVGYCGRPVAAEDGYNTLLDAKLVIEVLSPSTEAFDRGEKFEGYEGLASLVDYVLVDSRRVRVERFTKQIDGSWRRDSYGASSVVELPSLGVSFAVDEIYRGVELEPIVRLA